MSENVRNRSRPGVLPVALAACLVLAFAVGNALAQAVLNPNQVAGVVEFTNTDPDVLRILDPEGGGAGFNYGYIRAESIGLSPVLRHWTFPNAETPTRTRYEITVESSDTGIPYKVTADMRLDARGDQYLFGSMESGPLYPEPAQDAVLDFRQCAGLLDVRFVDGAGNPLGVEGGSITAWHETAPGSGVFSLQAQDFFLSRGTDQEYLAVHGDGASYRVDVLFQSGTDPYSDQVRHLCREFVPVGCDEIVEVVCRVDSAVDLGAIAGRIDMLGEDEHRAGHVTRLWAFDGPLKNFRYDLVENDPSSGPFRLENLMPSDAESPARGYAVYGEMAFRTGHAFEWFRTPWMYGAVNGKVMVEAGVTTDLGDTFVMVPGYVSGEVLLAGPPAEGGDSCLRDLHRDADHDRDGDGVPNEIRLPSSTVAAFGLGRKAAGASLSAQMGEARVGLAGAYREETDSFEGDYEMVLGGMGGESSVWRPDALNLKFVDRGSPERPETYQYSMYRVMNRLVGEKEIIPGSNLTVDHAYCFSEVQLTYKALSGTLYNPIARATGTFQGTDFRGNEASYYVSLWYALGTPTNQAAAAGEGVVSMCLPQGTYTLNPSVQAVNPGGGTSTTALPPVTLEVGCRRVVSLTTNLQVELEELPETVTSAALAVSGSVDSDGDVLEITVAVNSGEPETLCSDCGLDPEFGGDVTLESGENEITVTAVDEFDNEASVTAYVFRESDPEDPPEEEPDECEGDAVAPVVSCAIETSFLWPPNHRIVDVGLSLSVSDDCDEEVGETLAAEVWSDEPDQFETGAGTGNHDPDAFLSAGKLLLRRERRGTEDGRVYLVVGRATDSGGNEGIACCVAVVPHDRSKRSLDSAEEQAQEALEHCRTSGGQAPAEYSRIAVSEGFDVADPADPGPKSPRIRDPRKDKKGREDDSPQRTRAVKKQRRAGR